MAISVDEGIAFDNIQHPFANKSSIESGHRGNLLQLNKGNKHHSQPGKLKAFPRRSGIKLKDVLSSYSYSTSFGSPSNGNERRK